LFYGYLKSKFYVFYVFLKFVEVFFKQMRVFNKNTASHKLCFSQIQGFIANRCMWL